MREDWEYRKLGDVATFVGDGDWIESKDQTDEGIRLIQTGNVGNGFFKAKEDKPHFISEDTMSKLGCTEIYEGDCLVSRLPDPVGRACLIPNIGCRMITAVDCSIIRFGSNYLPQFFVDYSQSSEYRNSINNSTTGTTRKRISRKNLERILIPFPSLSEQERIVSELDLLSSIIEKKKTQLQEYDQLAQSIFYDMFGDPVTNEKGWELILLGDLCSVITKGTTPTSLGFSFVDEGINFVKVESFINGHIDHSKLTHISHECNEALSRSKLESEDLLVCIAGATIGKIALVDNSVLPANTNQACAIIRLENKSFLGFLRSYLEIRFRDEVKQMGKGVAQPNLSLGQLRNLLIPLPPLSLQLSFAEKIEAIEKQKEQIKQSITETETLFNSRMDYYFN